MSTRSLFSFHLNNSQEVLIYNNYGDFPETTIPYLYKFLKTIKKQNKTELKNCFNPSILAAKYIVWEADRIFKIEKLQQKLMNVGLNKSWGRFKFSSLGIINYIPKNTDYIYSINSGQKDDKGLPAIFCKALLLEQSMIPKLMGRPVPGAHLSFTELSRPDRTSLR